MGKRTSCRFFPKIWGRGVFFGFSGFLAGFFGFLGGLTFGGFLGGLAGFLGAFGGFLAGFATFGRGFLGFVIFGPLTGFGAFFRRRSTLATSRAKASFGLGAVVAKPVTLPALS